MLEREKNNEFYRNENLKNITNEKAKKELEILYGKERTIVSLRLKKENEKLKLNNENMTNDKEELMQLIQTNKNYEKENQDLLSQNKELKINNEEIINQNINLKKDLSKALNEMESYSELLQTLEMKIKEAESLKKNAENERDKAINDVHEIRRVYINSMEEKYG